MKVNELNRIQLTQLKQAMLVEQLNNVSYGELAYVDQLISDTEVMLKYYGYEFVEDDFK